MTEEFFECQNIMDTKTKYSFLKMSEEESSQSAWDEEADEFTNFEYKRHNKTISHEKMSGSLTVN